MASQRQLRLPEAPSEAAVARNKKMAVKRDFIKWLERKKLGWSVDRVQLGSRFVDAVADIMWYVDGHHDTLQSRACPIPADLKEFQGYNKPELTKHRRRSQPSVLKLSLCSL